MFILSLFHPLSYAQVKEIKNVPSPEVANLGTFGSIPVGHYTGTPNISIPLYSIKLGEITLPIQAMYHLSTVKPHTPPTTLGIGWALSAGGYIARTVKGVQDEKETSSSRAGYYFNHNKIRLIEASPDKSETLKALTHLSGNDWFELAADEFYFSFNGYKGTFFMDKDGQWQTISDSDIKVVFDESDGFKTIEDLKTRFPKLSYYNKNLNKRFFDKFTLITPDGTKYVFGGDKATEYCVPYYNQVNGDIMSTCWRLSRILTVDNRTIKFDYENDSYMIDIHYSPQTIIYHTENNTKVVNNTGHAGYTGFLTMPSRLTKITNDDEIIVFNYNKKSDYGDLFLKNSKCLYWLSNDARFLYNRFENFVNTERFLLFLGVDVAESENETQRKIAKKITQYYLKEISISRHNRRTQHFRFDYYSNYNNGGRYLLKEIRFSRIEQKLKVDYYSDQRFTLDSLINNTNQHTTTSNYKSNISTNFEQIATLEDTIKVFDYKFEYNTDPNKNNLWPTRNPLTYTDSWGYYSREGSNPQNSGEWEFSRQYQQNEYKNRPASLANTLINTLRCIKYPTGGKTTFEYELHTYSKIYDLDKNEVIAKNGTTGGLRIKKTKSYSASDDLILSKNYIYTHELNGLSSGICKGLPCFYDRIFLNENQKTYIDFYTFEEIVPYPLNYNTPYVGYSSVIEETLDGNGNLINRTKYKYSNYDTDINGENHTDEPADLTANVFGSYANAPFTSLAFERGKLTSKEVTDENNNLLERNTYKHNRACGDTFSTISHEWYIDNSSNLFALSYLYKTYTYKYLISESTRQETMQNGIFCSKNSFDYTHNGMLKSESVVSSDNHVLSTCYKYNFEDPQYNWMYDRNILVQTQKSRIQDNSTVSEKYTFSPSAESIPYISKKETTWSKGNQTITREEFSVEKTDTYGNPIEIIKDGGSTILLWSYKGKHLVAEIQNANYAEVAQTLGMIPENLSNLDKPSPAMLESLRLSLSNAFVFTYEYDFNSNLSRKTIPNGLSYLYTYDSLGRLTKEYRSSNGKTELLKTYDYNYITQ